MMFKIGDRVKYKNNTGKIVKESTEIIKDINSYEIVQYYFIQFKEGSQPDWFLESDLELVQTSEQIAVEKFKEEFRQILQKRLLEHKSCKDYWYDYLKKNSDTINKFDGECIVSDLNKISNYIYELEKVLFLFEKNSCKHKLESEDK